MSPSDEDRRHIIGRVEAFDPAPSLSVALSALDAIGAQYALIGGFALDAWGIPRATKDVDLAVPVGTAERAAQKLSAPNLEIKPLRIGGLGIRSSPPAIRIDLIDRRFHYSQLFAEAITEAIQSGRRVQSADREIPLVSLEYLIAMKLVSGEPKDDIDVRRILQLAALDYIRAKEIVEHHLGHATANRLDTWAREIGRPEVPPRRLYQNGDLDDE